jgi:hypothetical protein
MIKSNRMRVLFIFVLTMVLVTSMNVSTALGCGLSLGDPWYKVQTKVISNPLSNVLGISVSENSNLITFTNHGLKSNLYIASKDTNGIYPGYSESLRNYRPLENIIGNDFDPNIQISTGDGLPKGVYEFYGGWGQTKIGSDNGTNSGTSTISRALDSTDNYKTLQKVGDNRPNDVAIPEPDHETMYAFYQGKRYDIDIVLNYSLNKNYDSKKTKNSCGEERYFPKTSNDKISAKQDNIIIEGALIVAAFVAAIVFILYVRLLKNKNKIIERKESISESKQVRKK